MGCKAEKRINNQHCGQIIKLGKVLEIHDQILTAEMPETHIHKIFDSNSNRVPGTNR